VSKKLYVSQIEDPYIQENFKGIGDLFKGNPFLKGEWRFMTFTIATSGTGLQVAHNLPFIPADIILTSVIGGSITFNYSSFDVKFINIDATVSGATPMAVRVLVGKYSEDSVYV
jgi:hypothetical protein